MSTAPIRIDVFERGVGGRRDLVTCERRAFPIDLRTAERSRRGPFPSPRRVASPAAGSPDLSALVLALHGQEDRTPLLLVALEELRPSTADVRDTAAAGQRLDIPSLLCHVADRRRAGDRRLHELIGQLEQAR
jgi:hypothetical protein